MKNYDQRLFKKKRRLLELSSQDLADLCFLTRQTISAIENGKTQTKSTVLLIGMVLDEIADREGMLEIFDLLEA